MKKKIIAFCLLIAMLSTFLIGCGLVDTDSEKDLQRVIALVGNPDVYQDEIRKYELVNYYVAANSQSSEYGSGQSMEALLEQMIYRRITVQKAIEDLLEDFYKSNVAEYILENGFIYYEILGRSDQYSKDKIGTDEEYLNYDWGNAKKNIKLKNGMTIKDVLAPTGDYSTSEILTVLLRCYYGDFEGADGIKAKLDAIKNAPNDNEGFKLYYETIKDSQVFSDHLIIGAYNTIWESEKSTLDQIEHRLREESGLDHIEEEEEAVSGTRPVPKKDKEDRFVLPNANEIISSDLSQDSLRRDAFNKYKEQIKRNFFDMPYAEFYEKQLVSELEQSALDRHSELEIKNYMVDIDEFQERFNAIKNSEEQGFGLDLNSYETKLQNLNDNTFILYNPKAGVYGYVKHILLGLDTDLNKGVKRELDKLKALELTRKDYITKRAEILSGTRVKDLREDVKQDDDRFPGYDPYGTGDSIGDTQPKSLLDFYDKFVTKFGGGDANPVAPNKIYQASISGDILFDEFEKWIFMYNTDSGIFNNDKGYLLTEQSSMNSGETYMAEFAKAARDLIDNGNGTIGSYTLVATDFGYHLIMLSDIIDPDENETFDASTDKAAFDLLAEMIRDGKETPADKKTAKYKLYQIIKNEKGQEVYANARDAAINFYYDNNYYQLFKESYQDLLAV